MIGCAALSIASSHLKDSKMRGAIFGVVDKCHSAGLVLAEPIIQIEHSEWANEVQVYFIALSSWVKCNIFLQN